MTMNPTDFQQVRSTPLFAGLTDAQVNCLAPGEIIEAATGTVLASEGERTGFFHVLLEGEVRFTRTYDRQSILLGVTKPGNHLGETMLLLEIPWVAAARVYKPTPFFRLDDDNFWRMLTACHTIPRGNLRTPSKRMR